MYDPNTRFCPNKQKSHRRSRSESSAPPRLLSTVYLPLAFHPGCHLFLSVFLSSFNFCLLLLSPPTFSLPLSLSLWAEQVATGEERRAAQHTALLCPLRWIHAQRLSSSAPLLSGTGEHFTLLPLSLLRRPLLPSFFSASPSSPLLSLPLTLACHSLQAHSTLYVGTKSSQEQIKSRCGLFLRRLCPFFFF